MHLDTNINQKPISNIKHGVGCSSFCTVQTLKNLKVSWFYNWNYFTNLDTSIEFIPMCFSGTEKRLTSLPQHNQILLGFNQPDHHKQSNMSVDDAYNKWEILVKKSNKIVSPSMAGNPVNQDSWLQKFMKKEPSPKVDFIAVHWYGGANSLKFKAKMEAIYQKFQKPIWITQFACQTCSSSAQNPNKYTQNELNSFLDEVIPWLREQEWIYRYAWHHSKVGTSSLWNQDGSLTETGVKYASFSY